MSIATRTQKPLMSASVGASTRPSLTCRISRTIARLGFALFEALRKIVHMFRPGSDDVLLSYQPNRGKIVEATLFLIAEAHVRGHDIGTDVVIAAMFLADKEHLDVQARPVIFDNYVATAAGPAGVAVTEMLDPSFAWSTIGLDAAPWNLVAGGNGGAALSNPVRPADLRELSATDVDALSGALDKVLSLNAEQLERFTHRNKAFAAAWRDGDGDGDRLDPRLVPDVQDDELIGDLLYASRYAA